MLALGLGGHDQLFGLLAGPRQVGFALVLGNLDLHARVGQLGLHVRLGLGFLEHFLLFGRGPLAFVGLNLFDGQLPYAELFEQGLDLAAGLGRVGLANQHIDALNVEVAELAAQLLAGLALDAVPFLQQLQHGLLVGHVAEVSAQERVEGLRDQFLDVAEALDDAGRFLIVDVHHHGQGQHRLIGVLGHQVDGAQALVVVMGLGFARDPVQHKIRGRHQDDAGRIGVERVLAGPERPLPDAALALGNAFAVAEALAREIAAHAAIVADHDADVADGHDRFRNHLDGGKPAVDKVGAVGERDILPAAAAAGSQERLRVLIIVVVIRVIAVVSDGGGNDLAGR